MPCKLIADTRERNVLRHDVEFKDITVEVRQITVGDYVVTTETRAIAVIERKSLDDFAASLKDGRHSNKEKLKAFRAATGCRIIYIIEGPEFPAMNEIYGGIPYRHIQSSIFHLVVRDNVTILRSKDTLGTAKLLAEFMISMENLTKKYNVDEILGNEVGNLEAPAENISELLVQKIEKSDHDVSREMWSAFRGINTETADDYNKRWSIADVVRGVDLKGFKLSSGRSPGKKVVAGLTKLDRITEVRILTAIPQISQATAIELLNLVPMQQLIIAVDTFIAGIKIGKSLIGASRAARIVKMLNYKYVKVATLQILQNSQNTTVETPDIEFTEDELKELAAAFSI